MSSGLSLPSRCQSLPEFLLCSYRPCSCLCPQPHSRLYLLYQSPSVSKTSPNPVSSASLAYSSHWPIAPSSFHQFRKDFPLASKHEFHFRSASPYYSPTAFSPLHHHTESLLRSPSCLVYTLAVVPSELLYLLLFCLPSCPQPRLVPDLGAN